MVETLWEDVEGDDGVKERTIEILAVVKTLRAIGTIFGLLIAFAAAYAAWMSYLTAKHIGSIQASGYQQSATNGREQSAGVPASYEYNPNK